MSNVAVIREIYMGHLDAKDEISYGSEENFLQCFLMPPNYDINELLYGHQFLINGFKGVGKTALLFYLESMSLKEDPQTCTSFILFKSDYNDIEKSKLDNIAKRLIQSISFSKSIMEELCDFSDIWKIIIFQKLIEDNERNSCNLFINDENWNLFVKSVNSIKILNSFQKETVILSKVKLFGGTKTDGTFSTGVEIDFEKEVDVKTLGIFSGRITEITHIFSQLKRTDIPYYMFIDELEVFYADEKTFKRDLTMLRDLILVIKEINFLMISAKMQKTKILCSVRTEVINSIYRFIPTKELNKVVSGFECKLNWNYTNTIAKEHPLFKILLKRLEFTDLLKNVKYDNLDDVYDAWFQKNNQSDTVINHILNSLWNKPRDIIRLISAFKNSTVSNVNLINQDVINHSIKEYSNKSLEEICGELNAVYTPSEMEMFLTWIRGFKSPFSLKEFHNRVDSFTKQNTILEKINIEVLLDDLYRVGIIGNYNPYLRTHRWQHKNDEKVIIDESWLFVIHNGLNSSLSVTRAKIDKNKDESKIYNFDSTALNKEIFYNGIVMKIHQNRVFVEICHEELYYNGTIHISKVADQYISDINEFFSIGMEVRVKVLEYDQVHRSWVLINSLFIN